MTTQAVTDIKELVGEMPARRCEWPAFDCDSRARWVASGHYFSDTRCAVMVIAMCEEHKNVALSRAASSDGRFCHGCGLVLSASDLFGPVMPL